LILARDAIEALRLDRVIFVPAGLSPHKIETSPTPPHLRREMTARAIEGEPRFALDATELERSGPSFTIDTVEATRASHPEARLFYLVGSDNVAKLSTWHRFADLQALVEFVVFDREQAPAAHSYQALPRRVDISATEIRARVARGDSIRYLVPEPVREIIEQNRLYR
jgi:nicotinate-nucleotide adenylyltransferase